MRESGIHIYKAHHTAAVSTRISVTSQYVPYVCCLHYGSSDLPHAVRRGAKERQMGKTNELLLRNFELHRARIPEKKAKPVLHLDWMSVKA